MDKTFAKKQIMRMAQMFRFPKSDPEALGELIDAIMTAPTDGIAKGVVDAIMEEATSDTICPMPAEIKREILKLQGDFWPDPGCQSCHGVGDIVIERGGLSGSSKCHCWSRRPQPEYHSWPTSKIFSKELETLAEAKRIK